MEMVIKVLSSPTRKYTIMCFKFDLQFKLKQCTFLYTQTVFKKTYLILSLIVISKKVAVLLGPFALHKLRADVGEGRGDGTPMQVKASSVNR